MRTRLSAQHFGLQAPLLWRASAKTGSEFWTHRVGPNEDPLTQDQAGSGVLRSKKCFPFNARIHRSHHHSSVLGNTRVTLHPRSWLIETQVRGHHHTTWSKAMGRSMRMV